MKTTIIFLAMSLSIIMSVNGQDLSSRIGKTIHETIKLSDFSNYEKYTFIDQKPGLLSGIAFSYSDGSYIVFYVSKFTYTTQFRVNRKWIFSNIIKEKISRIEKFDSNGKFVDEAH